jgi:hypothetical protein
MAAIDDFQTAMTAAAAAIDASDWTAARRAVIKARIYLAQVPNVGADGVSSSWRQDLDALERAIRSESAQTTRSVTAEHYFAG